jgi:hypothetical protein
MKEMAGTQRGAMSGLQLRVSNSEDAKPSSWRVRV